MAINDDINVQKLRTTIGNAARHARGQAGLTQADVADRVGLATEVYGRLERGQLLPSVPSLLKLCLTMRVSSDRLLGLDASRVAGWAARPEQHEPPQLRRLLRTLRQLTPAQVKVVAQLAHLIHNNTHPGHGRHG
ncbi:MAG: helix-turn-helix domain-containing protein [Archangium sp.]